jgi:hypothetical protein
MSFWVHDWRKDHPEGQEWSKLTPIEADTHTWRWRHEAMELERMMVAADARHAALVSSVMALAQQANTS